MQNEKYTPQAEFHVLDKVFRGPVSSTWKKGEHLVYRLEKVFVQSGSGWEEIGGECDFLLPGCGKQRFLPDDSVYFMFENGYAVIHYPSIALA